MELTGKTKAALPARVGNAAIWHNLGFCTGLLLYTDFPEPAYPLSGRRHLHTDAAAETAHRMT